MNTQREIKFRVWNNTDKEMYFSKSLEFRNLGYMDIEDGGDGLYGLMGHALTTSKGIDTNKKEFIIQQFTGLKDPKGIDIYEGDIVRYKLSYINYFYDEVKWEHNGWRFVNVRDKSSFPLVTNLEDLEIIGNIFEAPELLEQ